MQLKTCNSLMQQVFWNLIGQCEHFIQEPSCWPHITQAQNDSLTQQHIVYLMNQHKLLLPNRIVHVMSTYWGFHMGCRTPARV